MTGLRAPVPPDAGDNVTLAIAEEPAISWRASQHRITGDQQHERHRNLRAAECPALPVIQPGELWIVEHSSTDQALSALGCHLLATANVVVYDRALYSVVAANLPVGGYAEPAAPQDGPFDTPIDRCIQFACDGWSVVRLADHGGITPLVEQMIDAGCPAPTPVTLFAHANGSIPQQRETELGKLDATTVEGYVAIAFAAVGAGTAPHLYAISSNGLAG